MGEEPSKAIRRARARLYEGMADLALASGALGTLPDAGELHGYWTMLHHLRQRLGELQRWHEKREAGGDG